MKNTLLIVDGMNTAFKAYYAYSSLTHKGKSVSIPFGLPMILLPQLKRYGKKNTIVVWEGKKSNHRLKMLPEYKAHRKSMEEDQRKDFFEQLEIARKLLAVLGVKQLRSPNMEADDLIYRLVKTKKIRRKAILSEDKDFLPLVGDNLSIVQSTKMRTIHHQNFKTTFNLESNQFLDYLCLIGDKSDNIPGVPGVGEVTALNLLNKCGSVKSYLAGSIEIPRVKKESVSIIYQRNLKLIDLDYHYGLTKSEDHPIKRMSNVGPIQKSKLIDICRSLNIKSFLQPQFLKAFQ